MPFRYKLNLIGVGWAISGALICALAGQLVYALICVAGGYLNWMVVMTWEVQNAIQNKED